MANPRNQHIGIPQIQYTDKVAEESFGTTTNFAEKRDQGLSTNKMTNQVGTQTRTPKAKLSSNTIGFKGRMR